MIRKRTGAGSETILPFEKELYELEDKIKETEDAGERAELEKQLVESRKRIYSEITPWQRISLARHPQRPRMLDFVNRVFDDFIELHGDRAVGDDAAVVCGIARFQGQTVFIAGQQKGVSTDEKVMRNFGMAHPQGYRKAMRIFNLAERLGYPVITFVDTPAAHPGIEAERYGQGPSIAQSMLAMLNLNSPVLSIVLSEGGSGGALAIAVGDWIAMFENAMYVICPPERCAEILWRDVEKKELASSAMRVSAKELKDLGAIDKILPEVEGAHRKPDLAAAAVTDEISFFLKGCQENRWSRSQRQEKFRKMGMYEEVAPEDAPENMAG